MVVAGRGRVPMRRDQLADQRPSRVDPVSRGELRETKPLKPIASWHPTAKKLYASFASSGQVDFWQDSDWALAFSVCEDISHWKRMEDAAEKSRLAVEDWDRVAARLKPAERVELGYSRERPQVLRGGSAAKMDTIYKTLGSLLVTEADRRTAKIELHEPAGEVSEASIAVMREYRERAATG